MAAEERRFAARRSRMRFTSIVHREEDHYVALCPELDVVSQGDTVENAAENLQEACELFLEHACGEEISSRLKSPVHVTYFEAGGESVTGAEKATDPAIGEDAAGGEA
jgi:predicted RNase H-like HicB family nuclease